MNRKGFTLIELLIVVAIIGILAAVGAVVIPNVLGKTKATAVENKHKKIFNHISTEIINCYDLRGKITVISRGNVVQTDCSIDPFVQHNRAMIYGFVSGYIYSKKIFGDNPFDPSHYEGGYKHELLNKTNPDPILGMTNCGFYQNPDVLYCWSRFKEGSEGVITSTYRFN